MQDLILVFSFGNVIFWILLGIFQRQRIDTLSDKVTYLESKAPNNFIYLLNKIQNLESILKEAGIIIEPPTNISVPDPRGYSVKKVK